MYRIPLQNVSNSLDVLQKRKLGTHNYGSEDTAVKKPKESSARNERTRRDECRWSLPVECVETEDDLLLEDYIGRWLKRRENFHIPKPQYLTWQPFITQKMRAILVDWLMQVATEFKLQRETTHMAINYVGRILSLHPKLPKEQLQLVGITALFVASKLEEINMLEVTQLTDMCDNAYTKEQLLQTERFMTQKLDWNLLPVTSQSWLKLFFALYAKFKKHEVGCDESFPKKDYFKCMQLLDYCTLDYASLPFTPCVLAAAVFSTFCKDATVVECLTRCNADQLKDCLVFISQYEQISAGKPWTTPLDFLSSHFHETQYWSAEALPFVKKNMKNKTKKQTE